MSINPSIFGAYDIRGVYPDELNEEAAYKIGRAFGLYLKENESKSAKEVIVGYDARVSSPVLKRAFAEGLMDEGVDVLGVGLVTVDAIYFASGFFHLPAAIITASHNRKEYNGFKLMKSDVDLVVINDLKNIIDEIENSTSEKKGALIKKDITGEYIKHVLNFINTDTIRPMRIVIDASSGAAGPVLKTILEKLPIEYTAMNFSPNGEFPYHEPDPTREKNITDLKNRVSAGHYHFGCAFDGDGDRVIFVDEKGESISTSVIGALFTKYFLKKNPLSKIVYSVIAGKIVSDTISAYNGEAVREKVGHTFIREHLRKINGLFGIETSGHYFFQKNFYADSGIISFLTMLEILSNEKKSLSVLVGEFSKYVSIPEMNFKIKESEEVIKKVAQKFEGYDLDWLDGLSVRTPDFWLNLRPSNTEPLLRLNIEAKNELILNRVKAELVSIIRPFLK
ncbi:MAG: phosphomannomutase/phosphoglucomutase [Patescibacteria group bacterium]